MSSLSFDHYPLSPADLPPSWTVASIEQISASIQPGFPSGNHNSAGEGIPHLRPMNVDRLGQLDFSEVKHVSCNAGGQRLAESDVLFNNTNSPALIGKTAVINRDGDLAYSNHMTRIRLIDGTEPGFIARQLHFLWMTGYFRHRCVNHVNQASVSSKALAMTVPIFVPPFNEQRRIVAKLDELLSDLDAGVAALERVKANLKRYRAAVLKAAVEGRLTEEWRAKNRPIETGEQLLQRILHERRRRWEADQLAAFAAAGKLPPKNWRSRYKEPVAPNTELLPELPERWVWGVLEAVARIVGGLTKDQKRAFEAGSCEVPYLRVANVQRGFLDLGEIKTIHASPRDICELELMVGDILFTEGGDRDKLGRGWVWNGEIPRCIHQNHIFRARLFGREVQPEFVSHHGNSFGKPWFVAAGKQTTNLASINLGILRRFPVPIAPADEQRAVVRIVRERLSQIDVAENEVRHSLTRATKLRQSVLKRAFAGKLVAQDPADEPAAVLLARIEQSRAAAAAVRTKAKPHSDEFLRRAAIVSYTIKRLAPQPSFGRTQLEKTLHLAQSHLGIELGLKFERYAAGPFDKSIYRLEGTANKSGWFTKKNRPRVGVTYHPGPKIDSMCQHAARLLGDKQADFDRLLDHVAGMNTDEAELFSTAYAAWNDLLIDGRDADDGAIIKEIHGWHASKKKFTRGAVLKRLEWMRRNQYVPTGGGYKTIPMRKSAGSCAARRERRDK